MWEIQGVWPDGPSMKNGQPPLRSDHPLQLNSIYHENTNKVKMK